MCMMVFLCNEVHIERGASLWLFEAFEKGPRLYSIGLKKLVNFRPLSELPSTTKLQFIVPTCCKAPRIS